MPLSVSGFHQERIEEGLFLGNRFAASQYTPSDTFDSVLTVSRHRRPLTTVHRPILDGAANAYAPFAAAVDVARDRYRTNGSLLVHCEAGISRSVAVVATTLTAEQQTHSFEQALGRIREVRPSASPTPSLIRHAEQYLGESIDDGVLRGPTVRLGLIRIAQTMNRWRLRLQCS